MIIQSADIKSDVRESADVCIIGSGCGGGAAAKVLSEAGKRVIILEEGGHFTAKDFDGTEEKAYRNLYRRRAGQSTDDLSVTILQGRCVGGSSTVNWTTSLRTPEFVLATWVKQFGLSHRSPKEMEPYFDRVERYLHIHLEPDEHHSPNNRIILDGARALGYRAMATGRNTNDCIKAGACGLGCPFDAKMSVDRTYVPDAIRAGATLFPNFRAERIEVKGRMKRVHGDVLDRETNEPQRQFAVEAPVVIVSAGAIHSPLLLLNSKVANSSGEVGRNLTLHVTTAVLGIFDRVIYAAGGIPQSAMCNEFLNKNGDGGGYWIEAVPVYPALAGIAVPSFGKTHQGLMEQYPHIGASIVLVKEIDSNGRITANEYGRPSISYTLREKDLSYLKHSLEVTARIHFAGGAKTVMTLHTEPMEFHSVDEIGRKLERAPWGKNELALFSAHPLGTCRMGSDPRRSVVDAHCQSHDVKGLFVIDGSVTPTSLGVNPQMTILSLAEQSAEWVAENWTDVAHG